MKDAGPSRTKEALAISFKHQVKTPPHITCQHQQTWDLAHAHGPRIKELSHRPCFLITNHCLRLQTTNQSCGSVIFASYNTSMAIGLRLFSWPKAIKVTMSRRSVPTHLHPNHHSTTFRQARLCWLRLNATPINSGCRTLLSRTDQSENPVLILSLTKKLLNFQLLTFGCNISRWIVVCSPCWVNAHSFCP